MKSDSVKDNSDCVASIVEISAEFECSEAFADVSRTLTLHEVALNVDVPNKN
jgi:hypothetical protein